MYLNTQEDQEGRKCHADRVMRAMDLLEGYQDAVDPMAAPDGQRFEIYKFHILNCKLSGDRSTCREPIRRKVAVIDSLFDAAAFDAAYTTVEHDLRNL